jgi:phosphohistidine phosphatase
VLAAIDWPQGHEYTVVVGHQPWIGQLASLLLAGQEINWSVKKSGIWWLTARTRESEAQVVLRAVIPPNFSSTNSNSDTRNRAVACHAFHLDVHGYRR